MIRLIFLLSFGFCLLLGGFVWFANDANNFSVSQHGIAEIPKTDAIVVLTGGKNRIRYGLDLLKANKSPKLLISGILQNISKRDVIRNSGFKDSVNPNLVYIDYKSTDTVDNAKYSAAWLKKNNVSSIILVTSTYHMRRSLLEFQNALPKLTIHPYGVNPLKTGSLPWSGSRRYLALYFREYLKYLGVLVKTNLVN